MNSRFLGISGGIAIAFLGIGKADAQIIPVAVSPMPDSDRETGLLAQIDLAQVDPGQDRLPEPELPVPLPPDEVTPEPTVPEPSPSPGADTPFPVTDVVVVGSSIFDDATLAAIVAPYENRDVTLAELQDAADEITQLYLNDGYITSRAVVSTQTVVDGVVQIDVIEGELEAILVEGTDTLEDYVRVRIAQGGTTPLNQGNLEDQLRLLRVDPMFDSVEASLRSGTGVGQSQLVVRVEEASTVGGSIFSDNYSPPSVGNVRVGANLQFRNLAGLGDTLFSSATWTTTAGSKVYEIGYRVPINPMNGTVLVRATPNEFEITDPNQPTFDLGTEGSTDIYEVSVRQPLVRTPRDEFALSLGYRYRDGSTLISGIITDSTTTSVLSFGQDYVHRDVSGAWALQSQFRLGTEEVDDTVTTVGDSDGFFSWIGQVQRVQRLNDDHLLQVQASLQLTPNSLPGSEKFFSGGGLSVRGYDQNQRFGDNGFRFSVEDQIVITRTEEGLPFFRLAPFLDGAYVWNDGDSAEVTDNNFLLGTGVGVLFNVLDGLNARADFAYPLIDVEELSTDDPPGLRFYFTLGYQF
ncbi:ShlB/FhaC/HecB family hemolysin secretion/activation protein [Leptolyngbya iicbica]|uniref:ShlB/FhaC/HecB family hemolysin secretion/activation protein n=2 Tax=Cyanophyceae TaxID=3028117 RepID=A0A4Q7E2V9_9CYAN|nr:ShlB/FhaC/HecB family hemolysin secretion/activation protein [Leptolyngbya sp. LK]RZM76147.1 ShlB/FhaC/HecB family hemolysin secretion/activation protein [Leptolyngbya sp. LK]